MYVCFKVVKHETTCIDIQYDFVVGVQECCLLHLHRNLLNNHLETSCISESLKCRVK